MPIGPLPKIDAKEFQLTVNVTCTWQVLIRTDQYGVHAPIPTTMVISAS